MAKTVLYAGDGIKTFIPQREPMLMVDKLFSVSENDVETGLTVADSNIFVEDGVLSETGLIEHIAQSAAILPKSKNLHCNQHFQKQATTSKPI